MKPIRRILSLLLIAVFISTNVFAAPSGTSKGGTGSEAAAKTSIEVNGTRILVKYKNGNNGIKAMDRTKNKLKLTRFDTKKKFRKSKIDILEIGKQDSVDQVVAQLKSDPDVEYVQPDYKLDILSLPQDKRFGEQWGLLNSGQPVEGITGRAGADINAVNAWSVTPGSPSVIVGVLDTGIDINHIDLKDSVFTNRAEIPGNGMDDDGNGYVDDINGWDFVNEDNTVYDPKDIDVHGTQVAGIIAASSNTDGITGAAPGVKVLPLKFIHGNWGYTCDAIEAIEYAMDMGVKIINCSFGGTDNNFALKDTMVNSGILFVTSAGNRGEDVAVAPVYPACFNIPNVLSVASIDSMGVLSPYSSYGSKIHVAAPGINILSTVPDGDYDFLSGTSASAPFVTAAAALLKSHEPSLTYSQLSQRITDNVVPCTNLQGKVASGGRVDAYGTLVNIKPQPDTYTGPGNDEGSVHAGQQGGNEDTWYTLDQLAKIKEKLHYGESGVNPASGNYSMNCTDMSVPAPGFEVNISRTYNSRDDDYTPIGRGWTFGFEGSAKGTDVVEVSLPNGSSQRFRLTDGVYKPEDNRSVFVKNADNTFTLTTKDQYRYHFDTNGWLVRMEDKSGNAVNIQVTSDGKVHKIIDTVGREYTVNYNSTGLIDNIVSPEDRVTRYEYDAKYDLVKVTDAMGGVMRYFYDSQGYLAEVQDHYQKTQVKLTYNHSEGENQHKVSEATDALGDKVSYSYDMANKKTTIKENNEKVSTYWFDSSMYTIRVQDPEGKSTYTEYFQEGGKNKYGDVKSVTDRNGNKTQYEIDGMGNVTKTINPDGSFKEFAYDDKNNLVSEKDEEGKYTFYVYDTDKKLLLKRVQPLNGTEQYTAGSNDSGFAITTYEYYTKEEAQTLFGCNAGGLLKSETDPEGNMTVYTYDADGNIKSEKDPEDRETKYTYNRIGQKTGITSPRGFNTSITYDKNGLMEKTVLEGGETTRVVYDMDGRKLQEIAPKQYDPSKDELAEHKYTDSTAGYRYTYYDNGMLKAETDPENNTTSYTYDVYGNRLTETKPNGSVYRYEYDVMDRVKKVFFKANEAVAEITLYEYSYATLDNKNTQKTETKYLSSSETATTVYIYDYEDKLLETQNPDGTKEKTKYNKNGTVDYTVARDGRITQYKYDGQNRLAAQWEPLEISGGNILYAYTGYVYDKAGNRLAEKAGKEKVRILEEPSSFIETDYEYYKDGALKQQTDSEGRKTEYSYDEDGNKSYEAVYTGADSKLVREYASNHLGKVVEEKLHVSAGDIYGNSFGDMSDRVLAYTYTYDKDGNLETSTTPDGITTTYTYDNMDRQLTMSQPGLDEEGIAADITVSSTYDWEGKLLTRKDANGNTTSYAYDLWGNLVKVTDPKGGVTAYAYDYAGRKTIEVAPKNYDPAKSLTEMNRIEYQYDTMDRLLSKLDIYMDPNTNQWTTINTKTCKYDNNGNVIKESDALGYESGYGTEYTYDFAGNVTTIIDPESKLNGLPFTTKYEYDSQGRKIKETNARKVITAYAYDDAGDLLSVKVRKDMNSVENTIKTYTYDLAGRKLTETDANGNTTGYEYNALGKNRKVTYPGDDTMDSLALSFQYDVDGSLVQKKDDMGRTEQYTYDNQDRVLTAAQNDITIEYRYDKNGNKRYETDGNGNTKENVYDEQNRLVEVKTTASGTEKSTAYTYDANGNQETTTDWRGNTYTSIYDPLNRLIEKKDPYGTVQKLEYDRNSRQSKAYDALGNVTEYAYDRNGRLVSTKDPEGHTVEQDYDDAGNLLAKKDGRGLVTAYGYDEQNRLAAVTNAYGETTAYTYDGNGNMLTQTDAKGNVTAFEYNSGNKAVRKIDQGGKIGKNGSYTYIDAKVESYTYYADGSMKSKTDRNGKTTEYTYDVHGRLQEEAIGDNTISYTYDNNGNQLTMTDSTGTTERTYDEENRVLTKTVPDIGEQTFSYDMPEDNGGYAEQSIDPKGNTTRKAYDKAGRLIRVEADGKATSYEYNMDGSRKSVVYPDGSREDYTYYMDGLAKTLVNTKADGTVIDSYSYTYDAAHNQTAKTDSKGTTRYEYDSVNRLSKVVEPDSRTTSYKFDKAGNRAFETVSEGSSSVTTAYEYNEQNRLTKTVKQGDGTKETVRYDYDNNGNTLLKVKETVKSVTEGIAGSFKFYRQGTETEKGAAMYEYDVWNRLISSEEGDKKTRYRYNGDGQRVEKTANGYMEKYLYEADKVVLEVDGHGGQLAKNTYGTNLLSREVDGEAAYYMYNGHGDVTALLDAVGSIKATYYYDAFGNPTEQTGTAKNPYRYAGYRFDDETGLYYLSARYYDSTIARFMTEDTYRGEANDPLSLNLYTYCHNEPIMYDDPTGHKRADFGPDDKKGLKSTLGKAKIKAKAIANTAKKQVVQKVVQVKQQITQKVVQVKQKVVQAKEKVVVQVKQKVVQIKEKVTQSATKTAVKTAKSTDDMASKAKQTKDNNGGGKGNDTDKGTDNSGGILSTFTDKNGLFSDGQGRSYSDIVKDSFATTGKTLNPFDWSDDATALKKEAAVTALSMVIFHKVGALAEGKGTNVQTAIEEKVVADSEATAANSKIQWPPNDGFEGTPKNVTIQPGNRIDRYGYDSGKYASPEGTPYEARSLAPGTENKPYKVFEVLKPIRGQGGVAAPWFDQPGGGIQFKLDMSIEKLLDLGRIKEVTPK